MEIVTEMSIFLILLTIMLVISYPVGLILFYISYGIWQYSDIWENIYDGFRFLLILVLIVLLFWTILISL